MYRQRETDEAYCGFVLRCENDRPLTLKLHGLPKIPVYALSVSLLSVSDSFAAWAPGHPHTARMFTDGLWQHGRPHIGASGVSCMTPWKNG